jgi:hypothetical protein
MKYIFTSLILLAVAVQIKAQAPRFMFSDSLITAGLSPVPVQLAKKNKLKKLIVHRYRLPADSFLFRSFHYDTAGYLVKVILHNLDGSASATDSLVYNNEHQLIQLLSFYNQPYKVYYTGNYRYSPEMVALESNFMHSSLKGRGHETRYYDNNHKLVRHVSRMDGTKKKYESVSKYHYDKDGFPSKIVVVNVNEFGVDKHVRNYVYTDERQKLTVVQQTVAGNTTIAECTYNKLSQCTGAIFFLTYNTITHDFFYYPNGILSEWYEKSRNGGTVSYRFYYECL